MAISSIHSSILAAPVSPAPTVPVPSKTASREIATAVQTLNQNGLAGQDREFSIAIDAKTKVPVVRIVDSNTRELIEQIPSQAILDLAQQIAQETTSNSEPGGR